MASREELEREQMRLINERERKQDRSELKTDESADNDSHRDRDRDKRRERNGRWNRDRAKERRFEEDPRFDYSNQRSPQHLKNSAVPHFEKPFIKNTTKHNEDNGLIPVLRHLSLLESQLGSLGSKAVELLSEALYMEKTSEGADVLVSREELFLETLKEKLIGLLEVGFMDQTLSSVADITIQKISSLLIAHRSGKFARTLNERERDVIEVRENNSSNYLTGMKPSVNNTNNPSIMLPHGAGQMEGPQGVMPNMWGGMMGPMGYPMMGMNPMMGPGMMDPNMMMGQFGMMPSGMMASDGSVMGHGGPMAGPGGHMVGPGGPMVGPGGPIVGPGGPMVGPDGTMMMPGGPILGSDPSLMTKEVIQFKSFTLYPPNMNAPPPATRERPLGCKTIFVGGLPENATEEMMREIFSRCGEMMSVRLSNKKFCHIRFMHEASVDAALFFSGFRMCIDSSTDPPNTGRLHVDFAQARDDQYDWECRQRQLQREQRHRDRVEKERLHIPSPPPVVHYSDHEANAVSEKIKSEEHFPQAVDIIITWLERGSCNKRNANMFYSIIQSTNSHVRRLLSEKASYEDEFQKAKDAMRIQMQGILTQFDQIEQVFTAASHKKVWDHFTKAQRKNIEMWKKQATELKTVELEQNMMTSGDDEMDVSDNEDDNEEKKMQKDDSLTILKDENDNLRCQLEAYKNEMDLVRHEYQVELDTKEKQLKLVQQTMHGLQQQLLDAKRKENVDEVKMVELKAQLETKTLANNEVKVLQEAEKRESEIDATDSLNQLQSMLSEKEAKLIGLITIFLHVHPFGASTDYIWSYLHKLEPSLKTGDVDQLMMRFTSVFQQELSGIGANMERRWVFQGFKHAIK